MAAELATATRRARYVCAPISRLLEPAPDATRPIHGIAVVAGCRPAWRSGRRRELHLAQDQAGVGLARAGDLMRGDAAIHAMPEVRYRLHRSVSVSQHRGAPAAATAQVMLHRADAWEGRCGLKPWADRVHFGALSVHLNDLTSVLRPLAVNDDMLQGFMAPRETGRVAGHPVYDGRLLVLTAGGLPPFVPVTVGAYLDAWQRHLDAGAAASRQDLRALTQDGDWKAAIAELERSDPKAAAELRRTLAEARQMAQDDDPSGQRTALRGLRRSLSAAQLAAPAYVSADAMEERPFAVAAADAPGAQALVQVNAALWRGAGSLAVRVVALEVFLNKSDTFDTPDDSAQAAARAWLRQVDPKRYASLLTP
jgi:hypothetical protein